jgi:hypothetical protein
MAGVCRGGSLTGKAAKGILCTLREQLPSKKSFYFQFLFLTVIKSHKNRYHCLDRLYWCEMTVVNGHERQKLCDCLILKESVFDHLFQTM